MDNSGTQANQTMEEVDELLKMTETLNPWEQTNFRSSTQDFRFGIIGKTEFNSVICRLKDNLRDPKIVDEKPKEKPIHNDPKARTGPRIRVKPYDNRKEDVTNQGLGKIDKEIRKMEVKEKLSDLLKAIEETLSPRQMRLYTSLCKNFQSHRIEYGTFVTSLLVLIEGQKSLYHRFIRFANGDKEEQEDEVKGTRHGEDTLSDPKEIGTRPEFRVEVDENPQERKWDKTNLEGKNKRRNLFPKDLNLPLKKRRKFEQVTPSYRLIPEERRSPVSDPVLNNTCVVKKYDIQGSKKVTRMEQEKNECEDQMYETDMLMSALRSAVDSAERVMRGEMKLEDLGVKFYRCVESLYRGDMFDIVREDHHGALPVILKRLNQKLRELTVARESWKRGWKKTFKRLSPTQQDSDAQKSQVKETTI